MPELFHPLGLPPNQPASAGLLPYLPPSFYFRRDGVALDGWGISSASGRRTSVKALGAPRCQPRTAAVPSSRTSRSLPRLTGPSPELSGSRPSPGENPRKPRSRPFWICKPRPHTLWVLPENRLLEEQVNLVRKMGCTCLSSGGRAAQRLFQRLTLLSPSSLRSPRLLRGPSAPPGMGASARASTRSP